MSVARRRDAALFLLVAVAGYQAASPGGVRAVSSTIVISEFRVRGPNGGNDEFVELYNLSAAPIAIGGWKIRGSNSAGSVSTRATVTAGTVLNPGCHYLVTNSSTSGGPYSGAVPGNQTYGTGITDDGGIALTLPDDVIVDQIGLSAGSAFKEGAPLASLGSSNQNRGYERKPGGPAGGGTDTDNNTADFQVIAPSDPQNLSSACITGDLSGTGAADPASVLPGDTTLLTVAVSAALVPPSTGIGVTADLDPIGGSGGQAFFDDGTHGDRAAGDHVFSFMATVGLDTPAGERTIAAHVFDAQGRTASATIAVAVQALLAIHDIQGPGTASPHEHETVATTGIVTGRKSNGFFIQAPDAEADGDPATSEGVFVFTGSAPPSGAAVGNLVRVTGTIQEFVPSPDPSSPPATELAGSPAVSLISTGHPLPEPVTISAADTDPAGSIEQLERREGMRVHVDSLTVVAPTQGSINEANATSTSNGVFYGVITGVGRPFREPGVEVPDPLPAGSPCCVPRFDANPERLRVDSDGQPGAPALDVATGMVVTDLTGVLDYSFRTYTVLPDPATPPTVTGAAAATPVPAPAADEYTVASFNMERLFDTVNDPSTSDPVLTPTAFDNRLAKLSLAIRQVMGMPDILGVEEVENLSTLRALADRINGDALASGDANPGYRPYLVEGNDVGGIDVGLLVKSARVTVVDVQQVGKDTSFIDPNCPLKDPPDLLNDRPPLVLRATVNPPAGTAVPVTVIVNHLRSLSGIDSTEPDSGCSPPAGTDGARVRAKRNAQAQFLADLIQARQTADPSERIVVVGDFNAYQFSDGYVDVMGTVKGTPADGQEVVLAGSDLVDPDLVDLVDTVPGPDRYSYSFDGSAQVLDHVLANPPARAQFRALRYARNDADFPEILRNDPLRPERISDHDMPVAYFRFPAADLGLTKATQAATALSGSTIAYALHVSNLGPDAAVASVSDPLPAGTTFLAVSAPERWSCRTPAVGGAGSVACTVDELKPGDTASLFLAVRAGCDLGAGTVISNNAAVVSAPDDPRPANNLASAAVTISNPPPTIAGLAVDRPVLWPPNHEMVDVAVAYSVSDNCDPSPSCQLRVTSNEPRDGRGDGHTAPDWEVVDGRHVRLRAERSGAGNGRFYTVTATCIDAGGAVSSAGVAVSVPKSASARP